MHSTTILPNLPAPVARHTLRTLCAALPTPIADTPEDRATRDEAAMEALADLHPADAFEARLAAQIVAADAHAMDCLRLAGEPGQNPETARQCRAQAATMMRHMQGGLRALERRQAKREEAEAALHPAAMDRAGYWFRDVSVPADTLGNGRGPTPSQAEPPEPASNNLTDAEQYAVIYPDRAARIRAHRGLPARLDFGPPDPDIVAALVNGTSPILRALDRPRPAAPA